MHEISLLGDVSENDLLQIILQGIPDRTQRLSILYSCKTLQELKSAIPRYERAKPTQQQLTAPTTTQPPIMRTVSDQNVRNENQQR